MHRIARLFLSCLVIMAASACNKGTSSLIVVSGTVLDQAGTALGNTTVTVLNSKLAFTTDATGAFSITDKQLTDSGVTLSSSADTPLGLRFENQGYARAFRRLVLVPGRQHYLSVSLPRAVAEQTITLPAVGQSVTVRQDYLELQIPGGALVKADGTPVTGDVQVWLQPYAWNDLSDFRPGDFRSDAPDGQPQGFKSKAMFNYTVKQGGVLLGVAPGTHLTLAVATESEALANITGDEHLYSIGQDSANGLWHDEAPGVIDPVTKKWTAPVTHFSACCCNVPANVVHFHGRVYSSTCSVVPNLHMHVESTTTQAVPTDGGVNFVSSGQNESLNTDSNGEFHFPNIVADSGYGVVSIKHQDAIAAALTAGETMVSESLGNDIKLNAGEVATLWFQYCLPVNAACKEGNICCGGCCDDGHCQVDHDTTTCKRAPQMMCTPDPNLKKHG